MHYIGMDCHITTLEFVVVDETGNVVTSAKNFMEFIKSVPRPRTVYMEEAIAEPRSGD